MTEIALKSLKELTVRFPQSKYAKDAKLKLDLTRDHLAGKEMEIGRYYLKQAHYLAAINRFKAVVVKFQSTTHVPEALHRLAESYVALGIKLEAQKVAAVLGHNFPGSQWYMDAYALVEGKLIKPKEDDPWYKLW
jgi:outer membrane protein assembly factor BamD